MNVSKNNIYRIMQPVFWMLYGSCYGFVSYYIVTGGFGAAVVGIVSAVAGILSALFQPLMGALADNPKIGWKKPMMIILILLGMLGVVLGIVTVRGQATLICGIYGLIMLLLGMAVPFLNFVAMAFPEEINFGIARGIGSLGYAFICYIMGILTAAKGPLAIPAAIVISSIVVLAATMLLPNATAKTGSDIVEKMSISTDNKPFLLQYPVFLGVWVASIFMLTSHSMANSFLLQILEKAGGNTKSLGFAAAIAAVMETPVSFFYEKINKRISARTLFIIAAATYFIRSFIQLRTDNLMVLYGVQLLQITSWGIFASGSVYYANAIIPSKDSGKAQAYMNNSLTIGSVVGALLGGWLLETYDVNTMLIWQMGAAGLALLSFIAWRLYFGKRTLEGHLKRG